MNRRLFKILKRILITILILIAAIVVTGFFYMRLMESDFLPILFSAGTRRPFQELTYHLKGPMFIASVICGLGVGSHFERWGFPKEQIIEKDWNEMIDIGNGFAIYTTPARHFSGRGLTRNNTLWMSYVLKTPSMKVYIGGDSGYDTHYSEIGNQFGPIDVAILDNGQYDLKWRYIHTLPEEVIKAAADLKAKRLFPVHSTLNSFVARSIQ